LGIFYALMVIGATLLAKTAIKHDLMYAALFFFMILGYGIDETTDWRYPEIVMNVDIMLGFIIYFICQSEDEANKPLGMMFFAQALWTGAYLYGGIWDIDIQITIYAMVLNFLSIISWVWFANLAIMRGQEFIEPEEDRTLYLRVIWQAITTRKQ